VRDRALALLVAALSSASCGAPAPTPSPPIVVTFEVAGDERYKVLLSHPDDIDTARRLLAGEDRPSIPNGRIVRGTAGVNDGYSWSIDPDDITFDDVTIADCDGAPSDVEDGVITGDRFCPWSAVVVAVDPAP
jgi:hypothetical protein